MLQYLQIILYAGGPGVSSLSSSSFAVTGFIAWWCSPFGPINHQLEWHRRAAAGNESIWGQRGDEGIEYRTLASDDEEIGRRSTMQVPTNDRSGKGTAKAAGDESERRQSHYSKRRATTIAGGGERCNNEPTAGAAKRDAALVVVIIAKM